MVLVVAVLVVAGAGAEAEGVVAAGAGEGPVSMVADTMVGEEEDTEEEGAIGGKPRSSLRSGLFYITGPGSVLSYRSTLISLRPLVRNVHHQHHLGDVQG